MSRKTQAERAEQMRRAGELRSRSSIEASLRRGKAQLTPGGAASMRRVLEPMAEAIRQFITEASTGGAGRRHTAVVPLSAVDPYLASFLTVQHAINGAIAGDLVQSVAYRVGWSINGEVRAAVYESERPEHYLYLVSQDRRRGRDPLDTLQSVLRFDRQQLTSEEDDNARWPQATRLLVGAKLLDLAIETLGVFTATLTRSKRKQHAHRLDLTPGAEAWLKGFNEWAACSRPLYLPHVERPTDWASLYNASLDIPSAPRVALVRTRSKQQRAALEAADLSAVYAAVNALQATPWQVNGDVLATLREAWSAPADFPDVLPLKAPKPLPEPPASLEGMTGSDPEVLIFRRAKRDAIRENRHQREHRIKLHRLISHVGDYADEPTLYFPHTLDFRGRVYPLSAIWSPQGDDVQKALLRFADGKVLGERGEYWLAIHGSNVFGNDKVPFSDRYIWAWDNLRAVVKVALDPLTNRWWMEADKPWQFLAWCFEWAAAVKTGDPRSYVSHLPVALDGSCNGLQHFAALLRDEVAGCAVNLTPSAAPSDIYGIVADKVIDKLMCGPWPDSEYEAMAANWLACTIDRKITKRAVMVLPYGGTIMACQRYVREAVEERAAEVRQHHGPYLEEASSWLAMRVWETMGEVIVSAREAMTFIQKLARVGVKHGVSLSWVAPSGFPVVEHYPQTKEQRITTRFHGTTVRFRTTTELERLDPNRFASASAPNFVHSLDAAALHLTVNACQSAGLRHFAMIHDSYGVHAADTDLLSSILRREFVRMYSAHKPLEALRDGLVAALPPGTKVPDLPRSGSLDLEQVNHSLYFFA